jgi:hypothetical protein
MTFGARTAWCDPVAPGAASLSEAAPAPVGPPPDYPRLKLSYRRFSISNLDLTHVPLQGAQLDAYPLSMQWVRGGFEIEGGTGHAALNGVGVDVRYGLIGLAVGAQYAAPITPFVEARFVGGILAGDVGDALAVAAATASAARSIGTATTWIYGRGLDAGAEVFVYKRAYVSASIGWLQTTWRGVDYAAVLANPSARLRAKDLSADSFTFKLGVGI